MRNKYDISKFGARFLELRKARGLSQMNFGRATPVSKEASQSKEDDMQLLRIADRRTVSDWEQGKRLPKIDVAIELCEILDCDLDYLFGKIDTHHNEAADIQEQTGISIEAAEKLLKWSKSGFAPFVTNFISKMIENDDLIFSLLRAGNEYTRIQEKEQLSERTDIIDEGGGILLMGKKDALQFLSFEIQRLITEFAYSYFRIGETEGEGEK